MTKKKKNSTPNEAELFSRINPLKTNQLIAEMEGSVKTRNNDYCNRCGHLFKLDELFDCSEEGYLCEECLRQTEEEEDMKIIEREEVRSHYSDEPILGRKK